MTAPRAERSERFIARCVSAVMEPIYYWLGWLDPGGHPANSKVVYTIAAIAAIVFVYKMGLRMIEKMVEVNWPYVGLVAVVLSFAAGVEVFKRTVSYFAGRTTKTITSPAPPTPPSSVVVTSAPTPGATP